MSGIESDGLQRPTKSDIARADGIYTGVTENFQRGPLKEISRAIKATQHDAGVVIYGTDL